MFNWIKPKNPPVSESSPPTMPDQAPKSKKDDLIREAMVHAKTAREAIGEETLAKVRDIMQKQQQKQQTPEQKAKAALQSLAPAAHADLTSPMEQAKKILQSMEPGKLADHLRLLREHDKTH